MINIPSVEQLKAVDYCGAVSGRDVDKFAATGLTPIAASEVKAPLIAECPVNIECKVTTVLSLGTHDVFVGRVVAAHADEDLVDVARQIDASKVRPFTYVNQEYWGLGGILERRGVSVRKVRG